MSERPRKSPLRFSAAARARLARTLAERGLEAESPVRIERRPEREGPWPLSPGQQRLWLAEQVLGKTPLYHVPLATHLVGPLDISALGHALDAVVHRYDILRASFVTEGERAVQRTLGSVSIPLVPVDLTDLPASQRYSRALELAREEFRRPFDLEQGPPLRAALWKISDEEHVFLLSMHHLVCDGATIRVLCDELAEHYAAECSDRPLSLIEPELQYGDWAVWQQEHAESSEVRTAVDYFAERLGAPVAPLELPTDHPRPQEWNAAGGWSTRRLEPQLGASLAELARAHGATPFQLFLAGYKALLHRLTHQNDLAVGIPIALRELRELERMPGFLVNTMVVRTQVDGRASFVELLTQVRNAALDASTHRAAPLEKIIERLRPERDPSRLPLFDVMFDHRSELPRDLALTGLTSGRVIPEDQLHSGTSKVDLALYTELTPEAFSVSAEYRSDLFEAGTIDLWLERFEVLLRGIAGDPHARIDQLPLLGAGERETLRKLSHGARDDGCETTIHAAFSEQAHRTPDKIALEHAAVRVSYRDLEERSSRLARHLQTLGVEPGEPVGLCLPRSDELVVAMLAITKAGGAYLPLDPGYPEARLRFMLQDSGTRFLVSEQALADELPCDGLEVVRVDTERERIAAGKGEPLEHASDPSSPAYIIYTSGSTGTPKGVACPHRGVLRLFRQSSWLTFDEDVRMLHVAPESFDASVLDIWGPLVSGGTLVMHPERTPTLDGLARVVREHEVNTLFLTTALFHALVDETPETLELLRQVATGGEAMSLPHLRRARERCPGLAVANCYGPTEATVMATSWSAPDELPPELTSVPIGTPLANTSVHVLDENLRPVPLGVAGELYVGGPGIANGYWRRPELTSERFPRLAGSSAPVYRTGDLVRWRHVAGRPELEFLGRGDDQVKIRGHRIELGEIEARLGEHEHVGRAVVVAREDVPGTKSLVAYVVPTSEEASEDWLSIHLASRLPEYMRPSRIVLLDELPITPGGKIDRARLPAPDVRAGGCRSEPPRGTTEEVLGSLWCELLKLEQVGRQDDFFALGGQSLAATVLLARIRKHLGVEVPLATLFRERTLANLARALEGMRREGAPETAMVPRREGTGPAPVSPNQRGLWFLQKLAPRSPFYSVPFSMPLRGELDVDALARSLAEIVARHESLRTRFPLVDGVPVQVVEPPFAPLRTIDLGQCSESELHESVAKMAREPFDIEQGPLFRAQLVRTSEHSLLAINVHHIVFDGWSFDVFVDELVELYGAKACGGSSPLPPLELQYGDMAAWWVAQEGSDESRAALEFWKRELAGAPPVLELQPDRPRPAQPSWQGGRVQRRLPARLVERLTALARAEGATPYLTLLSLTQVLLARYAGVEDLVLGTPVAARTHAASERMLGLFLNVLAIRADLSGAPSFRECLARTKERVLRAHSYQECPFERLVEALDVERDPAVTPVYQVLFSLRKASQMRTAAGLVFEPALEVDAMSAKTDLAITVEEREGDWLLDLSFATDLFDASTMERFGEHFVRLLAAALDDPARAIWELEILGQSERHCLLEEWSGETVDYPRDLSLAVLFEHCAKRHAERVAVAMRDETLTYGELNRRANRLARHLTSLGIRRGSRVGLCVDRSFEMVVAMLAICKAGASFVPLDPSYPAERLFFMLEDSGIEVLLLDAHLVDSLPDTKAQQVVLSELAEVAQLPDDDPPARTTGADPAYVMYTSGSTGKPKGVEVLQRAISRLVLTANYAQLDETRTLLQLAPISFDASTLEIWGALLNGGKLVLHPERVPTVRELERVLLENEVTTMWLTAALFNSIIDEHPQALRGLSECLTGGEALSVAHVRRAYAQLPPSVRLINGYGPTENTTFTCCHPIPRDLPEDCSSIPIGKPIANTRVYVVDARMHPVPIGVPGELVTGGDGLARGYLDRPELNSERFVPNPFGPGKLYRTGDRVRWRTDGCLEFLGRTDDQVKIRGHRIELGEVASLLGSHPAVRKAFVTVHASPQAGKQLVSYFEGQDGSPPSSDQLSLWLSERLPDYMVPASFVHVEALPMNPNGKVDRKKLPEPSFESRSTQRPRNEMESLLASLWEQVLGIEGVGPDDDFFELGGHSLLAVKLVQAIREAFGQDLELSSLVSAPTLAAQARILHMGVGSSRSGALVRLQPEGHGAPVFCVCSLGGTVLNQRPLALRIGDDRPFFGLQAIDLESKLGHAASIEDYASAYIETIKKVHPRGPYVIGGHSFGGIVSFEIAQQLTSNGDEVEMLFILDSSLPNLDKGALDRLACVFAFLRGIPYMPGEALSQIRRDPEQLGRALKQKLRFVRGKAKAAKSARARQSEASPEAPNAGSMAIGNVVEMSNWPEHNRRIAERHWSAVLGYRPNSYPGRITLFRSRFQSPFLGLGSMMGWDRVALGGVEVVRVPGGHLSVLQAPNVDVLARRLRERLRRGRQAA